MSALRRLSRKLSGLSLTTDATTTPIIEFGQDGYAGGRIFIPAGSSITLLTFHDAPSGDDTFLPSQYQVDSSGAPAALTIAVAAGKSYSVPSGLFGAGAFRIEVDVAGTVDVSLSS